VVTAKLSCLREFIDVPAYGLRRYRKILGQGLDGNKSEGLDKFKDFPVTEKDQFSTDFSAVIRGFFDS